MSWCVLLNLFGLRYILSKVKEPQAFLKGLVVENGLAIFGKSPRRPRASRFDTDFDVKLIAVDLQTATTLWKREVHCLKIQSQNVGICLNTLSAEALHPATLILMWNISVSPFEHVVLCVFIDSNARAS